MLEFQRYNTFRNNDFFDFIIKKMQVEETLINWNGAIVKIYRNWLTEEEHLSLFNICQQDCINRYPVVVFGRESMQPRNTHLYADYNIRGMKYSGKVVPSSPWRPEIEAIRNKISTNTFKPNSCLVNGYVNFTDEVGWHNDKGMLDVNKTVCTISLGYSRKFVYRLRNDHKQKVETILNGRDLLYMYGTINDLFDHSIPKLTGKEAYATGPRYSLTFRVIADSV